MTITVTMLHTATSEDGNSQWLAGTIQNPSSAFGLGLIAAGLADAPHTHNKPVVTRNVGDGYALVLGNGLESQLTGAWDDLRFPAASINPVGATSPPALDDTVTGFPGTLLFAGNGENIVAGVAQMPHSWRAGSAIRPHIHWAKPVGSANAVAWEFYYRHLGFAGDVAGAWVGQIAGVIAEGDQTVSDSHIISTFGEVAMGGKRESSMICWKIVRQGGTDADAGTARLLEFDIHFMVDKAGTGSEIPAAL